MQAFYKSGKYFFAFAVLAFGIIQINVMDFMSALLPMPADLPGRTVFFYLISALFVAGGITMCINRRAGLFVGILFGVLFIYPHLVNLLKDLHNPGPWTAGGETLALCGGAFIIAGGTDSDSHNTGNSQLLRIGKILFALTLIVFAVQHFIYAEYISGLITAWIPFKLFFSYFVGVAFLASAISILTNIKTRLSSALLGFMFLFWVIFLHLPRVAADTHKETEKTSMFVAFAFSGIFFTIAALSRRKVEG